VPGRVESGPVLVPRRRCARHEYRQVGTVRVGGRAVCRQLSIHAGITQWTESRYGISVDVDRSCLSGGVRNCGVTVIDTIEESEDAVARTGSQHRRYDIAALPVEYLVP